MSAPAAPRVLLADDFGWRRPWRWVVEAEQPARSRVYVRGGRLWLDSRAGLTVWLDRRLSGRYRIEYEREVFAARDGDAHARLSDLNQFWAAHDPRQARLFTRRGALAEYDALSLYYVGFGGNGNTTTRFRRYDGHGRRLLLAEYTDPGHLLQPGRRYRIRIEVDPGGTEFHVDGERWFAHRGAVEPGCFGFRTTASRQAIGAFRVSAG